MDTGFLLAGHGVDAPDPIALAGKGLTLAQLMTAVQTGQLGLDTQRANIAAISDPRYMSALGLGGSSPGGGGPPAGPDMEALTSLIRDNPLAGPDVLKRSFDLRKEQATIAKDTADAYKSNIAARTEQIKTLGQFALKAAEKPTPQNIQGVLRQFTHVGVPADFFGSMPPLGSSEETWKTYLSGVAASVESPADQLAAARAVVMLPREAKEKDVGTAKSQREYEQMPRELAVKELNANTGAFTAQTGRAEFLAPKVEFRPGSNEPMFTQRTMGGQAVVSSGTGTSDQSITGGGPAPVPSPGGVGANRPANTVAQNTSGTVAPPAQVMQTPGQTAPAQASGAPPTFGPTPGKVKLNESAAAKVSEMQAELPQIFSAITRFNDVKKMVENDPILTGPIAGSDRFKDIAGTLSQLPGSPPKLREFVANTQLFDATAMGAVFNMMGENKGSMPRSTQAMQILIDTKPGTHQYKEALLGLTNALIYDLTSRMQLIDKATKSVAEGGSITSDVLPPAKNTVPELTDESARANPGATARGPRGTFKSDGSTWTLTGPPQ